MKKDAVLPKILGPFNRKAVTVPMGIYEKVSAKQEFKKDVCINEIMARAKRGQNPPSWMTQKTPYYGDFSNLPASLTEAYEIVAKAEEAFESLPLDFRRAIDHDPMRLEEAPRELWEKFGLLKKAPSEDAGTPAPQGGATGGSGGNSPGGAKAPKNPAKAPQGGQAGRGAEGTSDEP